MKKKSLLRISCFSLYIIHTSMHFWLHVTSELSILVSAAGWKNVLMKEDRSHICSTKRLQQSTCMQIQSHILLNHPPASGLPTTKGRKGGEWLYLAWQDVAKSRESVIKSLVVNGLVKILDEDVSHAAFSQWRITLWPHNSYRLPLDHIKVHGVQCTFS